MRFRIVPFALFLFAVAPVSAAIQNVAPPAGKTTNLEAPKPDIAFQASTSGLSSARLIAKAYGVEKAHEIEAIIFALNIQDGAKPDRREWFWNVADNEVEYRGTGPTGLPITHRYRRDSLNVGNSELNWFVDAKFVEDQFWLLFPFHLSWERKIKAAYSNSRQMYIEPRTSECVTVRYPEKGKAGGDVYEIFYGPDRLIREWAFVPKDASSPSFVTTWERHAKAGPLLFSLMRRSADGSFRLWYDRISVKLVKDGWVDAEPLEREP